MPLLGAKRCFWPARKNTVFNQIVTYLAVKTPLQRPFLPSVGVQRALTDLLLWITMLNMIALHGSVAINRKKGIPFFIHWNSG